MNKNTKQYGLTMPKKAVLSAPKAGNIFGDDNDSDADDGADWVKKALKAEGEKHRIKKQTRLNMEKALNEDPTIYQYDEVYDEIEKVKEQSKPVKKELKQPKYIHNLLKAAERRKIEQEHRMERMVQKEREAEGEKFADKESFVTSAYREKLEQFKKIEEEEERMDRLEAIADVTKQPDMSGFHRHLFAQTFDPKSNESHEEGNSKKPKEASPLQSPNIDRDDDLSIDSSSEGSGSDDREDGKHRRGEKSNVNFKGKNKRQYRKRVMEESESESEEDHGEKSEDEGARQIVTDISEKIEKNEECQSPIKKPRLSTKEEKEEKNGSVTSVEVNETFKAPELKSGRSDKEKNSKDEAEKEKPEEKPSIWEKRTVGPVFEAALQRYLARKALRLSGA
ncbi:nuclear speckle splicing regulatory protein 1 [Fopius arisanus]|uniref:Nuclear speckle splicing regulatory protein 1 n=1 Tax=Fopius arisanus TaxID=64838 RepID=A0A9R1TQC7_9HYME|nr:PREDICTED: nuclear speckle splicing regulatory protein 1 [Fopius arisanus]